MTTFLTHCCPSDVSFKSAASEGLPLLPGKAADACRSRTYPLYLAPELCWHSPQKEVKTAYVWIHHNTTCMHTKMWTICIYCTKNPVRYPCCPKALVRANTSDSMSMLFSVCTRVRTYPSHAAMQMNVWLLTLSVNVWGRTTCDRSKANFPRCNQYTMTQTRHRHVWSINCRGTARSLCLKHRVLQSLHSLRSMSQCLFFFCNLVLFVQLHFPAFMWSHWRVAKIATNLKWHSFV